MMRVAASLVSVVVLAACASQPSYTSSVGCSSGEVQSQVGGEAVMGMGSDGFISDTDLVFSTRITPGNSGCTTVGGSLGT